MKIRDGSAAVKITELAAVALLLQFATALSISGQSRAPADTTNAEKMRQQDMSRRELMLRDSGNRPARNGNREQLGALMAQVERDFNRILFLHNQLVRATSPNSTLDIGFVSDAAAEIRKRATRLQGNLGLEPESPQAPSEKPNDLAAPEMKNAIILLCKEIESFVNNPIIATPGTVNVEQLTRARRDLNDLIKLSGHIKKDAERLSKSAK